MSTNFRIIEATEATDLLSRTTTVTVRWEIEADQEQVVIHDLLDRLVSVTKVTLIASSALAPRVYLGGHRVSKVNHKVRDADSLMPSTIDVADSIITLNSLDVLLQPIRSKTITRIDAEYFRALG